MDFRLVRRPGAVLGVALILAGASTAFAAPHGGGARPMGPPGGAGLGAPGSGAGHEAPLPTLHEEAREEAKDAASSGLGRLLYATPAQVRARFGDPDVSRSEGKGAF